MWVTSALFTPSSVNVGMHTGRAANNGASSGRVLHVMNM